MWDLIVSVPDHCLSFYFSNANTNRVILFYEQCQVCNASVLGDFAVATVFQSHYVGQLPIVITLFLGRVNLLID